MTQRRWKFEQLIYAAAFLLALVVRLVGADRLALNNPEADLALQALALSRYQSPLLGPHPAYLALTTLLMYVFNAGNWVVRFWPAVAGSLIVLLPALFRRRIGRLPAVLLAVFLALDPALLAASRQVGSLTLAILFTLLAFGLWLNGRVVLAGLAAGIALLSGPQLWPGVISLAVAVLVAGRRETSHPQTASQPETFPTTAELFATPDLPGTQPAPRPNSGPALTNVQRALIAAAAVIFFVGTLFFNIPDGLSAAAEGIPAYLRGWGAPSGISFSLLLVALLTYELFPLFFGIWGGVRALVRRDPMTGYFADRFLIVWWLAALILALVYPGRQVIDIAWSVVPLWVLAARQVARLVAMPRPDRLPALSQMLLAAIILGFISMNVISIINVPEAPRLEYQVRLIGALVMLIASAGLIAWGWSPRVAVRGLAWAAGIILFIYLVSAGWNSVGLAGRDGEELWAGGARVKSAHLLEETLTNLNTIAPQHPGGLDLVVVDTSSPALRWLLRNVQQVSYTSQLPGNASPAIVITQNQPNLALAASYRGQTFAVGENVRWTQLKPADWLRWLAFRTAPADAFTQDQVILWARGDLFPGGTASSKPGSGQQSPASQIGPQ